MYGQIQWYIRISKKILYWFFYTLMIKKNYLLNKGLPILFKDGNAKTSSVLVISGPLFRRKILDNQPTLYVILDTGERLINNRRVYAGCKEYRQWLQCGKETFDQNQK